VSDVRTRKIPNALPITLAVFGLAMGALGGWRGLASSLIAGLLLLILGTLPFGLGLIGGGDIKLLAACGSVFGLSAVLPLVLYTAIMGGVLALVVAAATGEMRAVLARVRHVVAPHLGSGPGPLTKRLRLPYAVAIAAGVAWMLLGNTALPALRWVK
jgi:prepilin peptidase CpaA